MEKNEIFTFTAPNGAEVTAVVVAVTSNLKYQDIAICYAQNRLFTFFAHYDYDNEGNETCIYSYGETLVDYCIIPEYDKLVEEV